MKFISFYKIASIVLGFSCLVLFATCKKQSHKKFSGDIQVQFGLFRYNNSNHFIDSSSTLVHHFQEITMSSGYDIISFDSIRATSIKFSLNDTAFSFNDIDSIQLKIYSRNSPLTYVAYNYSINSNSKNELSLSINTFDLTNYFQEGESGSMIVIGHSKKTPSRLVALTATISFSFGAYVRRRASLA